MVCGTVCLLAANAYGQTAWYVDDDAPNDPGPGDPKVSDLLENGTAEHPFDAIEEGIDASTAGDTVLVLDGTYIGAGNKDLDFGGKAITVRSASGDPATCVINCQDHGRGFHFHNGEDADSVVQDLTIRNANSDAGSIYCQRASPTLLNCTIQDSVATFGAGVCCDDGASPTLTNCTMENNTASRGGGVGCSQNSCPTLTNCILRHNIAAYGAGLWCFQNSCPTLTYCTITDNAYSDYGAGVDCDGSEPTLTHCTLSDNRADYGGGALHCRYASPTLTLCIISNNAGGDGGGGLCSRYESNPTLTECTITGNTANNGGGGILCSGATATLTHCTVSGNTAAYGGGMDCLSFSNPMLTNCVITGNTATDRGGGVRCGESSPTLTNCIISGNTAASWGGGMCCEFDANPTLANCTVTGNTADAGGGLACPQSASPTLTHCILWADTPGEIHVDKDSDPNVTYSNVRGGWTGIGNIDNDPLFVDPDGPDNDPDTEEDNDYHLSTGSPCIEAGNPDFVPQPQETDMDAEPRIMGCRVDLGADEATAGELSSGDLDSSGKVDRPDIPLFIIALLGDGLDIHECVADMNGDSTADGRDIQRLVNALLER